MNEWMNDDQFHFGDRDCGDYLTIKEVSAYSQKHFIESI